MIGNKICFFQTIDSTNNFMKQHLNEYRHGDIVCAKMQSKGRGRRSNEWISSSGDLHISIFYDSTNQSVSNFDLILLVTNVMIQVLRKYNIDAQIKYPNDIVVGNKKIAGILVERVIGEADVYVIGVGLNIITKDFSRINNTGTSIVLETKVEHDYRDVLYRLIQEWNMMSSVETKQLYNEYVNHNVILNKIIQYNQETYHVKAISTTGELIIEKNGKETIAQMNEITYKEYYHES